MKKRFALLLTILLIFSCCIPASAEYYILSPEAYNADIPPCNLLSVQPDFYVYGYSDCGKSGSDDVWALFEQYVLDLLGTGSFTVARHDDEPPFERWCLEYAEGELDHYVRMEEGVDGHFAVVVVSHKGNVEVWYSRDIGTRDLRETAERLGLVDAATATPKPTSTPKPTKKPGGSTKCETCDGDGKCNNCGGDMWFEGYKWVWSSRRREYDNEYVRELCGDDNCFAGSCAVCDGDGWI